MFRRKARARTTYDRYEARKGHEQSRSLTTSATFLTSALTAIRFPIAIAAKHTPLSTWRPTCRCTRSMPSLFSLQTMASACSPNTTPRLTTLPAVSSDNTFRALFHVSAWQPADNPKASTSSSNSYPDSKSQIAFEKGLLEKTAKQNSDIILYDNKIVLYKTESDVMMYVVGGMDENEVMLYNVILALRDSMHLLFKYATGPFSPLLANSCRRPHLLNKGQAIG